jgi:hypothetical protein
MMHPKIWWQIYRPVIVSARYSEDFFKKLSIEQFKEIFMKTTEWPVALHIIAAEYHWIKATKPNYFIEEGVSDFVLATTSEHTIQEIKFDHPIGVSWHPSAKLPCCLVYPTKPAVIIHVNGDRGMLKGTWTAGIPRIASADLSELSPDMLRLKNAVFGLLTYMQAFPELVKAGLPVSMKERNIRFFNGTGTCVALHPRIKACPMAHYRTGHWRTLAHERFHRNSDGSIKIIYVNPAIVGFLTPFVVEDMT